MATTLLLVTAAYVAGAAQTTAIRWVALALTLLCIVLLGLLLRQLVHREGRRDDLLQAVLDSVPHILFYKDAASRYIGVNPVFERTFGMRAEDVVGKTDAELFGQALHDRFVAQDRGLLVTGEARTFDEQMPIDGKIHYLEVRKTPFHDAHGNAAGIVGLAQDVTERHRLRQQLEESNARLRNIIDSLPVAIVWYDGEGRAGLWNRKALALFGYESEEIDTVDKWFGRAYPDPDYREKVIERWNAAGAADPAGDISRGEYEITCKDGRVITAEIWGAHCDDVSLAIFDDVTERNRLRQQLEVSNARLSLALRAAQMGTWAWNAETDEFDLDTFEGRLFGLAEGRHRTSDLLAGNNIHPDDLEVVRDAARRALREGVAIGYEFRAPGKQKGGWRWVEGSAIRYSEPGKPTMLIGMNRDITERKLQELELTEAKQQAEHALADLAQSRADLDLALRSGHLGVWHSEFRGNDGIPLSETELDRPVNWDANTRRIFGFGPDQSMTRRHYFKALHPEDRERVLQGFANTRGGEYADQYRIIRPDGQVRMVAVNAAAPATRVDPDTGETVHWMTGIIRDITEEESLKASLRQKVSEAQLATSELEQARTDLELALRSGQLGAWRAEFRDVSEADRPDEAGLDDPIVWDANVRRIYGYGIDERVTRRHFFNALHPGDRGRVLAKLAEAADIGGDYTDQYRIVRPDGDVRWVAVHATFVSRNDPDAGESRWMTGIARDITEEESLKADLRQKALEAQLATEAKARFLAMMSHEIRTPMNGVVGMIELLLDTPLSADQKQMLKTCKDSAFVLLTVINDILDFSKIEAGKLELDYTQLSLRRLVEGVGEALSTHATQRGIDLDVEIASDVPRRVIGDRVRLRQVLTNLVGNAIKFTEQGGVIVTVSMERSDRNVRSDGRVAVRFDVVDSGIGMDEDAVRNLFQPFRQADIATTRRFGGTGLGLSIVKRLTELMKGQVECESRLLQGSRFSVVIPFEVATAAERDWGYPVAGVRILASVAQERRRRILSDFLAQFDAGVEFCGSGDALLARAGEAVAEGEGIDLVLLDKDWSISECAGLHRRFSEIPEISRLPFVAVRSNELVQAQLIPDVTLVNGNPLTRANLVHGIAVALGRVSPQVPAIAEDRGTDPAPPLSRDREEAAGRLILLAEDNPTNREVIARQLARLGYACDVAEDGARAWTMLASGKTRYALLLTDCHMPRLDGYALTQRIRDHERSNDSGTLPIVAITANALQGEGERCLALGMSGYLTKPLQIRELRQVLAEFLPPAPAGQVAPPSMIDDASSIEGTGRFHELLEILGGDEGKLRHVLGVFQRSTRADCEQLDAAQAAGDWRRVRELAHKLRSGCRQLGEDVAALALETVEKGAGRDTDQKEAFEVARRELHQVLIRVGAYLAAEPGRHAGNAD